jgi:protein MpaA
MALRLTALVALAAGIAAAVTGLGLSAYPGDDRQGAQVVGSTATAAAIDWRHSRALGTPTDGWLVDGVRLPPEGADFFTWDPGLDRSPSRAWRRWGTDRLVRTVLAVLADFRAAHPDAPRIGIGDLSLPHGGEFGARYGGLGHFSHQNGLDVDVYYPRRDRREREPDHPRQIDRRLAQDLLDRFLRAGAQVIFVGPHIRLDGPPGIVRVAAHHDNHMHVRIFPTRRPITRTIALGVSVLGRPIEVIERGDPTSARKFLVVGCIHGDECAGAAVIRRLEAAPAPNSADLWLLPDLNPDGAAAATRQNGRGVDLNRNFPAGWRRTDPGRYWGGPRPLSEPESRIAARLVRTLQPVVTIWFHQPEAAVRAWGPSIRVARRYARLAGVPFRAIPWPPGTVPRWQNARLGQTSFVVELPPGALSPAAARRYARAVLQLTAE